MLFFCYSNLKWWKFLFCVVFAAFYTPAITYVVQSAQIYGQKLRGCKGQEDRDCCFWCSTWNSVFLVCDQQLKKKKKRKDTSLETAGTAASLSLLQNQFIHL